MTPPPPFPILENKNLHIKKISTIGKIHEIIIFNRGVCLGFLPVKYIPASLSFGINSSSFILAVYRVLPLYSGLSPVGVISKLSLVIITLEISLLSNNL